MASTNNILTVIANIQAGEERWPQPWQEQTKRRSAIFCGCPFFPTVAKYQWLI